MRKMIATLALSLVAGALVTQPGHATETHNVMEATLFDAGKTPEVSTSYARKAATSRSALLLDTRTRLEFDAGHIPGALNIEAVTADRVRELAGGDLQKEIILYCNGPFCQASRRAADSLSAAGFTNVRRYQLGIPVWRALGGPVAVTAGGVRRIAGRDLTAVIIDLRPKSEFEKGSLAGAVNAPANLVASGVQKLPLPEDDFNTRVLLVAGTPQLARSIADSLGARPWHNVSYFDGDVSSLLATASR